MEGNKEGIKKKKKRGSVEMPYLLGGKRKTCGPEISHAVPAGPSSRGRLEPRKSCRK